MTWTYKTDTQGGVVTVIHKGTIESPDKISGTLTAVEYSVEGEFTATRAKQLLDRQARSYNRRQCAIVCY